MLHRLHGLRFQPVSSAPALQSANPATQTVARRPQTTAQEGGGVNSFVAESGKCDWISLTNPGMSFGGLLSKAIKPIPGYLSSLYVVFKLTGGTSTANVVLAADAPYSLVQNVTVRDPFGSVAFNADGFGWYLIQLYSGQVGACGFQNTTSDPNFAAITTTSGAGAGNGSFALAIPIEFDPDTAYCAIPEMNAAAELQLSIQLNPASSVYSTPPSTLPSIEIDLFQRFWKVPISDPSLAPPNDGSSHQWSQSQGSVGVTANGSQRITLPDVGTYLSCVIGVFRDSTGARSDQAFANDLEFWVDGSPQFIEFANNRFGRMFRQFGITRPTGVVVYTFRDSVGLTVDIDDMELLLPTTPGTLLELTSGAWGSGITNPPHTLTTYTGKLYPVDAVPERLV